MAPVHKILTMRRRIHLDLTVFRNIFHLIIYTAERLDDKMTVRRGFIPHFCLDAQSLACVP